MAHVDVGEPFDLNGAHWEKGEASSDACISKAVCTLEDRALRDSE